jgi:hypothetical protein
VLRQRTSIDANCQQLEDLHLRPMLNLPNPTNPLCRVMDCFKKVLMVDTFMIPSSSEVIPAPRSTVMTYSYNELWNLSCRLANRGLPTQATSKIVVGHAHGTNPVLTPLKDFKTA